MNLKNGILNIIFVSVFFMLTMPMANTASAADCTPGYYSPTGQDPCLAAPAGYYTDLSAAISATACLPGNYQPSAAQTSCLQADMGYFVELSGSTDQTACFVGYYQPLTGQASCLQASPGYYVNTNGAIDQTPAPAGYFASTFAATLALPCPVGTYQPMTGQALCVATDAGHYTMTTASITQIQCNPGEYQSLTGQSFCDLSDAGYYVDTFAAIEQTACPTGKFQSMTGASTCDIAPAGTYVDTIASISPTYCPTGTYQPVQGSISCVQSEPGRYVDLVGSDQQLLCPPGQYQPLPGQTACISADAGNYVANSGAISQEICPLGTYQQQTGQSACTDAAAGRFVSTTGAIIETWCPVGTYQPSTGQSECLTIPAGYYGTGTEGQSIATACPAGQYQPLASQTYCLTTEAGYYTDTSGTANQIACPAGTYQPLDGQSFCLTTSAGNYSDAGATTETACPAGTYQPSVNSGSCLEAPAGSYVFNAGQTTADLCPEGNYQPLTGQSNCLVAQAGYYVDTPGAIDQTACPIGYYQSMAGQLVCLVTPAGYYSDTPATVNPAACQPGSFQPLTGQTACTPANPGFYVANSNAPEELSCPVDTNSYGGANVCRKISSNAVAGVTPKWDSDYGLSSIMSLGDIPLNQTSTFTLVLRNIAHTTGVVGSNLLDLSVLDVIVSGTDASLVTINTGVPATLKDDQLHSITFSIQPDAVGSLDISLSVSTDINAEYGANGDVFTYALSAEVVAANSNEITAQVTLDSASNGGQGVFSGLLRNTSGSKDIGVILMHGRGMTNDDVITKLLSHTLSDIKFKTLSIDVPTPVLGDASLTNYIDDATSVITETGARLKAAVTYLENLGSRHIVVIGQDIASNLTMAAMAQDTTNALSIDALVGINMAKIITSDTAIEAMLDADNLLSTMTIPVLDLYADSENTTENDPALRDIQYNIIGSGPSYTAISVNCADTNNAPCVNASFIEPNTSGISAYALYRGENSTHMEARQSIVAASVINWLTCDNSALSSSTHCNPVSTVASSGAKSKRAAAGPFMIGLFLILLFSAKRRRL